MTPDEKPRKPKLTVRFYPTENGWVRCQVCGARLKGMHRDRLNEHALQHARKGEVR